MLLIGARRSNIGSTSIYNPPANNWILAWI
jgi:hypothetical protein